MKTSTNINPIIHNQRSSFNYEFIKDYEAGICLKGWEVRSLRHNPNLDIVSSYITITGKASCVEAYLINLTIVPNQGVCFLSKDDFSRKRKLLLHKREIINLQHEVKSKKLAIIPRKIYWKDNIIKLTIGLAKGKKKYDKRESLKKRDIARQESTRY